MPFPRKFKSLLEIELEDVEVPDHAWIVYAVCGCYQGSCGWGGWILEAAIKGEGAGRRILPSADPLWCPRCGKDLFRTEAALRMVPSDDQRPVHGYPGVDYEVAPVEFED
jgi:hypothetical protein